MLMSEMINGGIILYPREERVMSLVWSLLAAGVLEAFGSASGPNCGTDSLSGKDSSSSSLDTMGIATVLLSSYSGCASIGSPGLEIRRPQRKRIKKFEL